MALLVMNLVLDIEDTGIMELESKDFVEALREDHDASIYDASLLYIAGAGKRVNLAER